MKVRCVGTCLALAMILPVFVGCGGADLEAVSGTVTLDGAPLPDAMVVFTPMTGGRPAAGKTDSGGRYELIFTRDATGALQGEHVVEITTGDELEKEDGSMEVIPEKVPKKYNLETELRATIEVGANVFDFALDSEGDIVQESSEAESDE